MLDLLPPRPRPEEPNHPFAGQLVYQGIPIDVETAAGQYREGVDTDGRPWRVKMPAHYGEVRGTVAADGDAVDVFVGDDPFAPWVWVVQTHDPKTKRFDEPKCMLGYATKADAMKVFRSAYNRPITMGVTKWPIGAWTAALARPKVSAGKMDRPLTKGERLQGGAGDGRTDAEFDPEELNEGRKDELEHTSDPDVAAEIARDHLTLDPKFYTHEEQGKRAIRAVPAVHRGHGKRFTEDQLREIGRRVVADAAKTDDDGHAHAMNKGSTMPTTVRAHVRVTPHGMQQVHEYIRMGPTGVGPVVFPDADHEAIDLGTREWHQMGLENENMSSTDATWRDAQGRRVNVEYAPGLLASGAPNPTPWRIHIGDVRGPWVGTPGQAMQTVIDTYAHDPALHADMTGRLASGIQTGAARAAYRAQTMTKGTRLVARRFVTRDELDLAKASAAKAYQPGPAPHPGLVLVPTAHGRRWKRPDQPKNLPDGAKRTWTEKLDYLPDDAYNEHGHSGTQAVHKNPATGTYSPHRQVLHEKIAHEKIAHEFLDHVKPVPENEAPVAMVMMGGSASGKSTAVKKNLHVNEEQFVKLDADEVKGMIPEYTHAVANSAKNAAALAHEESSDVMKMIRGRAMDQRKNIIMDGTGANQKGYADFMKTLKDRGYHVHLVYTDTDKEVAIKRARDRAEKTGRHIPEHFIHHAYDKIPGNFIPLTEHADEFTMFDTRTPGGRPVWTKHAGEEKIHDPEFVNAFRSRYGTGGGEAMKKAQPEGKKKPPNVSGTEVMNHVLESMKRDEELHAKMPNKHKDPESWMNGIEDDSAFKA